MLNHQTTSKLSKERSKTNKVFPQINKDLSSLENNSKTEDLFLTTTFKKNQPFTWSWDLEVECKFSSKPWLERPSPLKSNHLTTSKLSRLRSKTRKVFPQINKDSFSPENNLKTAEVFLTTTSKKNPLSTWSWDLEVDNDLSLHSIIDYFCFYLNNILLITSIFKQLLFN